ncbi:hypothetical protein [Aestuariibacter salexigens]|uniref:hypothetical protein n=1 Tax=Aestuariibacter salexigens TaxID=226010 RepID=UPI0012EB0A02|nr:hypothetical protein [Aestuariibacter salexigens]
MHASKTATLQAKKLAGKTLNRPIPWAATALLKLTRMFLRTEQSEKNIFRDY